MLTTEEQEKMTISENFWKAKESFVKFLIIGLILVWVFSVGFLAFRYYQNPGENQQVVSTVTEKIITEDGDITYVAWGKKFTSDGLLNIGDNVTLLCKGNGNTCTLIEGE